MCFYDCLILFSSKGENVREDDLADPEVELKHISELLEAEFIDV